MPSFTYDRLTMLILSLTALLPFLAVSPAKAAPPSHCATEASAVRSLADTATPEAAARALRTVRVGEAICDEGNKREAAKKFDLARRQLGIETEMAARR